MKVIIKVMESLVKINGWKVIRFDLQFYDYDSCSGYVGYLDVEGHKTLIIHHDGSFEYKEN